MNFTSIAFLTLQLSSKKIRILKLVKCKSYQAKKSCFCNTPPTQFSNLRMRDTITLVTASAKLGRSNFQFFNVVILQYPVREEVPHPKLL